MYLICASVEQLPRSIYLNNSEEIDYYLNILFSVLFNIVIKTVFFAKSNIYYLLMDRRDQYDHTKFKEGGQRIYAKFKQSQY
jgi:hypothetical protein